jgi:uncharacterized protein YkwD
MQQFELKVFLTMLAVFITVGAVTLLYIVFMGTSTRPLALFSPEATPTEEYISTEPAVAETNASVLGSTKEVKTLSYDKLYSLINGYRREQKLSTLKAHTLLEHSATSKLLDMKERRYWTHLDPEGREPWYLFERNGYNYELAGENLSFGYTTEWRIFDEWTKSPEHNTQLLMPEYEHMGLAADCSSYANGAQDTCVVVLHLGKQLL